MKKTRYLVLSLALSFQFGAHAQNHIGMFNTSNIASIDIAGAIATTGTTATVKSQPAKLVFKSSKTVSLRMKDEFKSAVVKANPQKAARIEQVLSQQDVIGTFARDMAPYGLKPNNVADAMTAYWISMWMVANQASGPTVGAVHGVKRQVSLNLLNDAAIAGASEEQLQEVAEGLIYEAMFALGIRANAINVGDPKRLDILSENAYKNMLKLGVDIRAMNLTEKGFSGS